MPKLLIVEDEEDVQEMIQMAAANRQLVCIADMVGSECLAIAKQEKPDVILLDLNLPLINGLEILCALKKDLNLSVIPVIVFSANNDRAVINKAMSLGADAFFVKGTPLDCLFDLIQANIKYPEPKTLPSP